MILFTDTETTGIPLFGSPSSSILQPSITEIAAVLDDDEGQTQMQFSALIKPDGWTIDVSGEAAYVSGITTDMCEKCGIPLAQALLVFELFVDLADTVIGHNLGFEYKMFKISDARAGNGELRRKFENLQYADTMHSARKAIKKANLGDVYETLFGRKFKDSHRALPDTLATREVFYELVARNAIEAKQREKK